MNGISRTMPQEEASPRTVLHETDQHDRLQHRQVVPALKGFGWNCVLATAKWLPVLALISVFWNQNLFAQYDVASEVRFAQREANQGAGSSSNPIDDQPDAAVIVPSAQVLSERIAKVSNNGNLSDDAKSALLTTLQSILSAVEETKAIQKKQAATKRAIEAAPLETQKVKRLLEKPISEADEKITSDHLSLDALRKEKSNIDAQLAEARHQQDTLIAKSKNRSKLIGQLPKKIASAQDRLRDFETKAPTADAESAPALHSAQVTDSNAHRQLVRQQIQLWLQQQRLAEAEADLLPAKIRWAQREVERLEGLAEQYATAVNARKTSQLATLLRRYEQGLINRGADPATSLIHPYKNEWKKIVNNLGKISLDGDKIEQEWKAIHDHQQRYQQDIHRATQDGRRLERILGLKLQRARTRLISDRQLAAPIAEVDESIERARALQETVESLIDELTDQGVGMTPSRERLRLRPITGSSKTKAWNPQQFIQDEETILQKFVADIDLYVDHLIELKQNYELHRSTVSKYRSFIDQHVMWIRSDRTYNASDFRLAWQSFKWLVLPENVSQLGHTIWNKIFRRPIGVIFWIILFITWLLGSRYLHRRLKVDQECAIQTQQTSMRPTFHALLTTCLLAALPSLLLAIPGWGIQSIPDANNYGHAIGFGLVTSGALLLPAEWIRLLVLPYGLGVAHFEWKESTIRPIRNVVRPTIESSLIVGFLWSAAAYCSILVVASALGRLLFVLLMGIFSYATWLTIHPKKGIFASVIRQKPNGWLNQLRYLWHPIIASVPLSLGLLSLMGYRYSAEQLAILLYKTVWLGIGLLLLRGLLRRWVTLNRRQLLLQRIREGSLSAKQKSTSNPELAFETEQPTISLNDLNAQSLRLIHVFLAAIGIMGLLGTWSSVLPAMGYLQSIEVGGFSLTDSENNPIPFTLANLMLPIPIIALTIVAWRNLPGLLESVLLQRLPLDNATRYAITSLSSYALLLIGIFLAAAQLGLRWHSIQWLVAALGVGIGFGLQEIFANFISGIILLFEQPLRVGDVVTLGDTTGVVSRIRIRATTITNWDHQELVVPNKDLITGRLVNWTLSDSTNRIVLNVGVAYGTDTRVACKLLETICCEHANVANDPAPIITFEGFGDSTLDIVVRCYLNGMNLRLQTTHELHTLINERFSEQNIEIAFPQQDVNIRSLPEKFIRQAA